MKTIIVMLLCFCFANAATADVKIVQKMKSGPILDQPAKDMTVTMFIKGKKARTESGGTRAYQIIDIDQGKVFVVDPEKEMVIVMTTAMMKQAAGVMGQLAGNKQAKPVVERTGKISTYNGYKCENVKVSMPGMLEYKSTACISPDVDLKEFEPFKAFTQDFSNALGIDSTAGVPGFPVHSETSMNLMGQKVDSTVDVVSITREPLADSLFVVPQNYKVQEMAMPSAEKQ